MKPARPASPRVEGLESRKLLSADVLASLSSSFARPGAIARPVPASSVGQLPGRPAAFGPNAAGAAVPGPYTPAQIRHAYGVDQLANDGAGQTIAIVDAYDNPTIAQDLAAFDRQFNLPDATLIKATPGGGTPAVDAGWALEIALDVEWAHVIAPKATILLVEANSNNDADLLAGVDYAVAHGAQQVSMSWGGGEFNGASSLDPYFNHPGVTFFASAGDSGAAVEFPAVSPYVTGVGGTTLSLDAAGNKISETVWAGSGGGVSAYVPRPSYQAGFQNTGRRNVPDVAYDADVNSGVYVRNQGNWYVVGGTSAGAPQWAGLTALVNQGRAAAGSSPLGTGQAFGTNSVLYQLAGGTGYTNPNGDYFDITQGSNGTPATTGYDTATGLGSPVANKIVPDLIAFGTTTTPPAAPVVGDAGFEAVAAGPAGYAYDPTGSPWSFVAAAGLSANNSAFTSGNPAAPQGSQVAFLQETGSFSQPIAGWAAGSYTVGFQAAQRGNYGTSREDFQVLVDGAVVGTFTPGSVAYQSYSTASFTVAAGTHTVAFRGLDTAGGDNTAFIDSVSVARAAGARIRQVTNPSVVATPAVPGPSGAPTAATPATPTPRGPRAAFVAGVGSTPRASHFRFAGDGRDPFARVGARA